MVANGGKGHKHWETR